MKIANKKLITFVSNVEKSLNSNPHLVNNKVVLKSFIMSTRHLIVYLSGLESLVLPKGKNIVDYAFDQSFIDELVDFYSSQKTKVKKPFLTYLRKPDTLMNFQKAIDRSTGNPNSSEEFNRRFFIVVNIYERLIIFMHMHFNTIDSANSSLLNKLLVELQDSSKLLTDANYKFNDVSNLNIMKNIALYNKNLKQELKSK